MKTICTKAAFAAAVLASATWVAGCGGSGSANDPDAESRKRAEQGRADHLIGHDPRGLPVYGVDEDGKPVYRRDE